MASRGVVLLVAFLPATGVFAPGCPPAAASEPAPTAVIAVVGGRTITYGDLRESLSTARAATPPTPEALRARLDALVLEQSLAALARAEGYEQRPEVRNAIDRLLAGRYRAEKLAPRLQALTVSDEEVAVWYEGHAGEFAVPRRVRGAVVLVAVPGRADARTRAAKRSRAERALEEARRLPSQTAGFGRIAVELSDDRATRYSGGDAGWLTEQGAVERWGGEVARALFALQAPGALGPVVETPRGFALVRLIDERPATVRPLDEVREALRRRLLIGKQEAQERAFAEAVAAQAGARVDEARLAEAFRGISDGFPPAKQPPALPGPADGPGR